MCLLQASSKSAPVEALRAPMPTLALYIGPALYFPLRNHLESCIIIIYLCLEFLICSLSAVIVRFLIILESKQLTQCQTQQVFSCQIELGEGVRAHICLVFHSAMFTVGIQYTLPQTTQCRCFNVHKSRPPTPVGWLNALPNNGFHIWLCITHSCDNTH